MATLSLENRILILTNDDGSTSTVDLSNVRGDTGIRGPQGPAGMNAIVPRNGDEEEY